MAFPTPPENSANQTLRSTFLIGSASGLNILIGVGRAKVIAILLGPAGIGLLGLLSSVMSVASTLAGMGLASSGVRQLAASEGEGISSDRVRLAMWIAHLGLGFVGGVIVYCLREQIARWILGDADQAGQLGWLGLGVFLSSVAACQSAIRQGLGRIAQTMRLSVIGTFVGTAAGLSAIWHFGQAGILISILCLPASSAIVGAYGARRLSAARERRTRLRELVPDCRLMIGLGAALMIGAAMIETGQLAVRSLVAQQVGLSAAGYFNAAWAISMQYIGFALSAMSLDYLPRLSKVIEDDAAANHVVAEQAEISLLLAGPVILFALTLAPWIVEFLYSPEFSDSVELLRWQILGDFFKIAAWPLGFVLIAQARSKLFFITETLWLSTYLSLVALGLPLFGLEAAGVAFLLSYLIYFAAVLIIVRGICGFRHNARYAWTLGAWFVAGLLIVQMARVHPWAGTSIGSMLSLASAIYSAFRLSQMARPVHGVAGRIAGKVRACWKKWGFGRA